eukprot:GAFH01000973.1.p1 GENE.GAFH01000973.1~~GAFH01000973.1.p1  ORF type:complete len:382 (+),score=-12.10 GAFH01000973.1:904-2049(+)
MSVTYAAWNGQHERVFLLGGEKSLATNDFEFLDPATLTVTPSEHHRSRPTPRSHHCAAYAPDHKSLLVYGGRSKMIRTSYFNDLYRFDVEGMVWSMVEQSGIAARSDHACAAIRYRTSGGSDHEAFLVAGGTNGTVMQSVHLFDLETMQWVEVPLSPSAPPAATGMVLVPWPEKRQVLFVGGMDARKEALSKIYVLNLDTLSWSQPVSLLRSTYGHTAALMDRHCGATVCPTLVVLGGRNYSRAHIEPLQAFDLNRWTPLSTHVVATDVPAELAFGGSRHDHFSFMTSHRGGSSATSSMWVWGGTPVSKSAGNGDAFVIRPASSTPRPSPAIPTPTVPLQPSTLPRPPLHTPPSPSPPTVLQQRRLVTPESVVEAAQKKTR